MPKHSRLSGALLQTLEDFGTTDRLIMVIESTDSGQGDLIANRRKLKEFADRVAAGMEGTDLFTSVAYKITPQQQEFFEDLYFQHPFHYHSVETFAALENKLSAVEIDRQVADLGRTLRTSPFGPSSQRQLLRDPLGFRSGVQSGGMLAGFKLDLSDGYFFSVDGSLLVIVAKPQAPSQDTAYDAVLLDSLEQLLTELGSSQGFRQDYSIDIDAGLKVQLLGPYVETLYGSSAASKEIIPSIIVTVFGLLILFALVYRNVRILLLLAVPLVAGILMTSAMTSIFVGHLTMITVGFAVMLTGLGIDFGIHLVERIGQESQKGGNLRDSIARAFETTGRGVLAGALTSAVIFMLIATSDFTALQEFGWIIGLGILLTIISIFALLPALLVSSNIPLRRRDWGPGNSWATWIVSHYRLVAVLGAGLTLILGYSAWMLELESNIYQLGPMNSVYEEQKTRILNKAGGSTNVVMVVAERERLQDLLELSEAIKTSLHDLKANGEIDSFESLSSILLSRKSQRKITRTTRQWELTGAMANFKSSLEKVGFRTTPFDPFINAVLAYNLDTEQHIGLKEFRGTPGGDLVDRFLVQTEDGWRAVSYIYPHPGQWQDMVPTSVVETLEGHGPGIVVTGVVSSFNEIANYVRDEFIKLTLFALVAILLISMFFLRRPLLAVLAVVPAVLGLIWTLGMMNVAGIELNLVTVLIAPMILGLGVDDALHVLNRHQEKPGALPVTMGAVSGAVLMTSATTIIGFGSLAFADLPSLRALGITVSIGMVCCAVTSLVVLPALLTAFDARK
ncbi:MAG: MMPL family transporter [Desulfobacterales bacterium]|nr:MMPL family transporter [Desulfobacterales bacterium]